MGKSEENKDKVKKTKKQSDLVTKESFCAVCALFCILALLILVTKEWVFGGLGKGVHAFLTGVFGYFAFPVTIGGLYLSITALIGKRFVKNRKAGFCIICAIIFLGLLIHTATTYSWEQQGYLTACFKAGETFPATTATGWLGGLLVFAVFSATTKIGAIVLFSALFCFFGYLSFVAIKKKVKKAKQAEQEIPQTDVPLEIPVSTPVQPITPPVQPEPIMPTPSPTQPPMPAQESAYTYADVAMPQRPAFVLSEEEKTKQAGSYFSPFGASQPIEQPTAPTYEGYESGRDFLFGMSPDEAYRRNLIFDPTARVNQRSTPTERGYVPSYTEQYQSSVNAGEERPVKIVKDETIPTPVYQEPIEPLRPIEQPIVTPQEPVSYSTFETEQEQVREEEQESRERGGEWRDYRGLFSPENPQVFGDDEADRAFARETFTGRGREDDLPTRYPEEESRGRGETSREFDREPFRVDDREERRDTINIFDDEDDGEDPYTIRTDFEESRGIEETRGTETERGREPAPREEISQRQVEPTPAPTPTPTPPPPPPKPRVIQPYRRVPLDDFDCRDVEPQQNPQEVEETKANIIATLEDFKVTGATVASVTFGPTVTRYNVTIPRNISPQKVVALDQPIAISLRSSGVNIYPNYEDGVISIEVPNRERQFVQLGCMLSGDTFVNAQPSSLMFTMGKDAGNRKVYGDISKMIHLLVAGSSGSGKSVFLGSLIISLIYKYSPEELRLILIDPKKTEFVLYNNLPHLMINEIITDAHKAVQSLNWAIGEMNRRYGLFEQMSRAGTYVVNLDDYNKNVEKTERLPKIVIIIDELADLMLAAKKDVEDRIQNLTQKARAAGIHLVVATQRPSTDVITGVIKSNLNTRIAFAVATDVDSRVILDQTGAQKLLGKGDFLYTMQGINTPIRVQSAFISATDSQRVVNYIKSNNEAYYDENATAYINNTRGGGGDGDGYGNSDEVEPVYIEALRYVIQSSSASISLIQRKCSIGYNKAGKIVEWMEEMGYISSFDGAKARKVLITQEEFESKYGPLQK